MDSYETAASFLPAVRPLIDSLMTFFFSTLELLSSSAYLGFITADVVKHTVHALQLLLPFGECVVSEWGRVLMQCSNASNEQAQIEILKAVQVLIGMITSERDHDYCVIADEVVHILINSYTASSSLSLWFQRQEESIVLIRSMLQQPSFRTYLHSHIHTLLSSSSTVHRLAGVAICGGEMIGLYEGCRGVYLPRGCEMNEKNCGNDFYAEKKMCVVSEIVVERDVVRVVIDGEQEEKEVPFTSVDHVSPLPVSLSMLSPAIVDTLVSMFLSLQESAYGSVLCSHS